MKALAENFFHGTWRSFKLLKASGLIKYGTPQTFLEFTFGAGRVVQIKYRENHLEEILAETDRWALIFKKEKYYLTFMSPRLLYEVASIDQHVLILQDTFCGDKISLEKVANSNSHFANQLMRVVRK